MTQITTNINRKNNSNNSQMICYNSNNSRTICYNFRHEVSKFQSPLKETFGKIQDHFHIYEIKNQ